MSETGTITGFDIGKNKDGTQNVLLLQVVISDPDDVQTVEYMASFGSNKIPNIGARVDIINPTESWKKAVLSNDGLDFDSSLDEAEKLEYSLKKVGDDYVMAAFIKWLNTGVLEINGKNDFAVRFLQLEIAFNQLKSDHDTHTHPIPIEALAVNPIGTTPVANPVSASTADISPAKVDKVLIPALGE